MTDLTREEQFAEDVKQYMEAREQVLRINERIQELAKQRDSVVSRETEARDKLLEHVGNNMREKVAVYGQCVVIVKHRSGVEVFKDAVRIREGTNVT